MSRIPVEQVEKRIAEAIEALQHRGAPVLVWCGRRRHARSISTSCRGLIALTGISQKRCCAVVDEVGYASERGDAERGLALRVLATVRALDPSATVLTIPANPPATFAPSSGSPDAAQRRRPTFLTRPQTRPSPRHSTRLPANTKRPGLTNRSLRWPVTRPATAPTSRPDAPT